MIGAILGDMIGAPYEFDMYNVKHKDFPLWSEDSQFTDDSVMTVAVAKALINTKNETDDKIIKQEIVTQMQTFGKIFPYAGYGGMFRRWLTESNPKPYGSFGNGSAMRVSGVVDVCDNGDLEHVRHIAVLTAAVTHNHVEGIKGAEATATAIWMAKHGSSKEEIKAFIEQEFKYDLTRTCDEIRPSYHHVESCQQTVPEAITAFLESCDFEDAIRNAVSLGGDSDTLACITGGIAEGFYGVPKELKDVAVKRLPKQLLEVIFAV